LRPFRRERRKVSVETQGVGLREIEVVSWNYSPYNIYRTDQCEDVDFKFSWEVETFLGLSGFNELIQVCFFWGLKLGENYC
jgi:hypothetical protein